jgi:hypothetical protein
MGSIPDILMKVNIIKHICLLKCKLVAQLVGALAMIEKPCNTVTVALPWAML